MFWPTWPGRPEGGMGSKMRKLVLVALLSALAATASAQSPSVMGTWLTASGLAQVRIGPCPDSANGPICGLVVGLINAKGPDGNAIAADMATDYRNPDPARRTRKGIAMPLIWGSKKTADPNASPDRPIYNRHNGKATND